MKNGKLLPMFQFGVPNKYQSPLIFISSQKEDKILLEDDLLE